MALTPKKLYQGQLTAASVSLYAVANTAGKYTIVRSIVVANTDTVTRLLTLNHVPSGGTAGVANQIAPAIPIPGGSLWTFDSVLVLGQNEFVAGLCDVTTKLTVTISGIEGP